ncbi:MAG: DUF192 domain-containing protein [Candidatus Omnitrophota bacterium]|nr:MAG: DUF192 domain-containing protein [Candidatus Omnitrophota bacterium]
MYQIINKTKERGIVLRAYAAESFLKRLFGLMFKKSMDPQEALIFGYAILIHTCFMRFPIDVVFIDKNKRILKVYEGLKPWRVAACIRSCLTLELAPGTVSRASIQVGDTLEFIPTS